MILPYFIFITLLAICVLLILKWRFLKLEELNSKWLLFGFGIKFLMGFALWLIYTYYYTDRTTADIYKYYDDAQVILQQTQGNWTLRFQFLTGHVLNEDQFYSVIKNTLHWDRNVNEPFNDNRIMIRLNLLISFISGGLFHIHTLIFSFLSFLGSIALFKFIKEYSSLHSKVLFFTLFLIPSIIFWNSGVLKEAWLFFCLGFSLLFFQKLLYKTKTSYLIGFLVFSFLLFHIKPYVLLCLIPGLVFIRLDFLFNWTHKLWKFMAIQSGILFLFMINYHQKIVQTINQKKEDFTQLAIDSKAGSLIDSPSYENIFDLLLDSPKAFLTTLFRPMIWEVNSLFTLLSSIENILFIGILSLPIIYFKKPITKELNLVLFNLSFIVFLGVLIGLSTPVLGAVVRYKIPILPFYLLSVFTFVDFKKVPYIRKIL